MELKATEKLYNIKAQAAGILGNAGDKLNEAVGRIYAYLPNGDIPGMKPAGAGSYGDMPVSYTHLDVYKRQLQNTC